MKKLITATLFAFVLSTPAIGFDISGFDGFPPDLKESISRQSGGRITNNQGGQNQQQAGQDGQQQQQQRRGRQARKKQTAEESAMHRVDQMLKGDTSGVGNLGGQGVGSFR